MSNCIYCGRTLYPDDDVVHKMFGTVHVECSEIEDPEELD